VVLAAGITASLVNGLPFFGPAMITLAGSLASHLLHGAALITTIPGAWQRCPTPSPAWVAGGILFLLSWSFFEWRRFWIPCVYIVALLAFLACSSIPLLNGLYRESRDTLRNPNAPLWERNAPILSFTFLDVGEGDSIVICFPDKRTWLLDAGGLRLAPSYEENSHAFDIGEAVVSRYLWQKWIPQLDRLILSHADQDHAGGIPAVMKNFHVSKLGYALNKHDAVLDGILKIARERRVPAGLLHAGMEEQAGAVSVRVLHPRSDSSLLSSNENSIVLKFSYGNFSALLTGDLEKAGEREVLANAEDLNSCLLKVAHHGSRWGTAHALLDHAQARWAVVSVGRNNPFGHPSREAMARLRQHRVRPFLTLDEGAITFETDGSRYAIKGYVRGILEKGTIP
jgi:beta-lactamase superfamily II metal-dependent hydrolase